MLGRTARWLRLLGFDTYYDNRAADPFLRDLCLGENRVLLTKDVALHQAMPAGSSRLIAAVYPRPQLQEIVGLFGLNRFSLPPRCSLCNGELDSIEKEMAKDRVPPYVFRTQNRFQRCRGCLKIYWPGSHLATISLFLEHFGKSGGRRSC